MYAMASLLPALRQAAPGLTREMFECSHRSSTFQQAFRSRGICISSGKSFNPKIRTKLPSRLISGFNQDAGTFGERSSPLGSLSRSFQSPKPRARHFPDTSSKSVAYWLLGSAASVFGIVVFGGLTRLTESGYAAWQVGNILC